MTAPSYKNHGNQESFPTDNLPVIPERLPRQCSHLGKPSLIRGCLRRRRLNLQGFEKGLSKN